MQCDLRQDRSCPLGKRGARRGQENSSAFVFWLYSALGDGTFDAHRSIVVNVAVSAMRFATGPELTRGLSFGVAGGGS